MSATEATRAGRRGHMISAVRCVCTLNQDMLSAVESAWSKCTDCVCRELEWLEQLLWTSLLESGNPLDLVQLHREAYRQMSKET
eukprot:6182838-Pleurochrysis_carterae.AAC.1